MTQYRDWASRIKTRVPNCNCRHFMSLGLTKDHTTQFEAGPSCCYHLNLLPIPHKTNPKDQLSNSPYHPPYLSIPVIYFCLHYPLNQATFPLHATITSQELCPFNTTIPHVTIATKQPSPYVTIPSMLLSHPRYTIPHLWFHGAHQNTSCQQLKQPENCCIEKKFASGQHQH